MAIGYIELDDWLPFRKMFAYMDASDHYRADELLRKCRLKVKFKNEWHAPNSRYRLIFCTIHPSESVQLSMCYEYLARAKQLLEEAGGAEFL